MLKVAQEYGVPMLEDDAYGELRYTGEALPALGPRCAIDVEGARESSLDHSAFLF